MMERMPEPTISRMRWPFPLIWIIPIAAIAVAGYYFYDQHKQRGPEITIELANADGLRPGETPVDVLGVQVGQVIGTSLSQDKHHVLVHAQMNASDAGVAVDGSQFWIVRADLGSGNLSALSTVISGPYVEATVGTGKPRSDFRGRSSPPVHDRRWDSRNPACRSIATSLAGRAGLFSRHPGGRGAGHPA